MLVKPAESFAPVKSKHSFHYKRMS